jgi:hypothetical protein
MPVIPSLRRQRQEDHEFEASLGITVGPCLNPSTPKNGKIEAKPK